MLKRVMFYLMILLTASKFIAMTFVFSTDVGRLPVPVYVSAGIVTLFGIGLICKKIIKSVSKRELSIYYLLLSVSVVFNLIFMKIFCRVEVNTMDFMIIGTIMDILVSVTLVALNVRENRYVRVHMKAEL